MPSTTVATTPPSGDTAVDKVSATKRRVLDAAAAEFAEHGLAGARVDRIAREARASKERLYAYFGDKDALFREVLRDAMLEFLESVPFDATDLPGHAQAVFDRLAGARSTHRMLLWAQLQGDGAQLVDSPECAQVAAANHEAVLAAQHAGLVDDGIPAADLGVLVMGAVLAYVTAPGSGPEHGPAEHARRRALVGEAVRRLTAPRGR